MNRMTFSRAISRKGHSALFGYANRKLSNWLDRRIPPSRSVVLDHKKIFIFPNGNGFLFLGIAVVIYLGGVNYHNNLMMAFSFLLVSVFITGILSTYKNLSGLKLESCGARLVGAGETAYFRIKITADGNRNSIGQSLFFSFPGEKAVQVSMPKDNETFFYLPYVTEKRGYCCPGRLHLHSVFPLGLVRTWSWIDLNQRSIVHPRSIQFPKKQKPSQGHGNSQSAPADGVDEFVELRPYRQEDAPHRIDWKTFARRGELYSRQYQGLSGDLHLINWYDWEGLSLEDHLAAMAYDVFDCVQTKERFALRLPHCELPINSGEDHIYRVLTELALYRLDTSYVD